MYKNILIGWTWSTTSFSWQLTGICYQWHDMTAREKIEIDLYITVTVILLINPYMQLHPGLLPQMHQPSFLSTFLARLWLFHANFYLNNQQSDNWEAETLDHMEEQKHQSSKRKPNNVTFSDQATVLIVVFLARDNNSSRHNNWYLLY